MSQNDKTEHATQEKYIADCVAQVQRDEDTLVRFVQDLSQEERRFYAQRIEEFTAEVHAVRLVQPRTGQE